MDCGNISAESRGTQRGKPQQNQNLNTDNADLELINADKSKIFATQRA
jgi:hypothetical protein